MFAAEETGVQFEYSRSDLVAHCKTRLAHHEAQALRYHKELMQAADRLRDRMVTDAELRNANSYVATPRDNLVESMRRHEKKTGFFRQCVNNIAARPKFVLSVADLELLELGVADLPLPL